MSGRGLCIYWIRDDLRLADNPALEAALREYDEVLPVFIWSPDDYGPWPRGAASKWWLHRSLQRLQSEYTRVGSPLILRRGKSATVLIEIVRETAAVAVHWNRLYEPDLIARDTAIKQQLKALGVQAESFPGSLLFEPWELKTKAGDPYRVFTPFWKTLSTFYRNTPPLPAPHAIKPPAVVVPSDSLDSFGLLPTIPWTTTMEASWVPGESGAHEQCRRFGKEAISDYHEGRDIPSRAGTSRLSPHLHFGEITPRQIWSLLWQQCGEVALPYLRELGWRDFAFHLLFYFPETTHAALRPAYDRFPWRDDPSALAAWQRGQTGYPIVDAGMRELWATGWMHNRVRMIVGSFLVKHLLLSWRHGAAWFWDTLVDADLANNTLGWQWIAGCGADAAPYFRIFNPVSQGEKFDAEGIYVRRWVPELAQASNSWIHQPWNASESDLTRAGIRLGETYPHPIVEHSAARARALKALSTVTKETKTA